MKIYIVIVSPTYGGTEKRFFDIFTSLHRMNREVSLIAPSMLVSRLINDYKDREEIFNSIISVPMKKWSAFDFIKSYRQLFKKFSPGSIFHYPLNCLWPLHIGRKDQIIMSVADCTRIPKFTSASKSMLWTWISFFFVSRVDVLSPTVFEKMAGYMTASRMSLTPGGTYLIPSILPPKEKAPKILFLSRLVPGKGIFDLLDILPELWQIMKPRAPIDVFFQITGYGELENPVTARIKALKLTGIPIEYSGLQNAELELQHTAVLLSMQEVTNFPSRVVAEALISGCAVIVRDTGDSRKFGSSCLGLSYCEEKLDATDLANQLINLINLMIKKSDLPIAIRNSAIAQFNSSKYIDYYYRFLTGNQNIPLSN